MKEGKQRADTWDLSEGTIPMAQLAAITSERDFLRTKLTYAQSTIAELQRQNAELDQLLTKAHETLLQHARRDSESAAPKRNVSTKSKRDTPSKGLTWIGGSWLSIPDEEELLGPAVAAWERGKSQDALNLLGDILSAQKEISPSDWVRTSLLLGTILRQSDLPKALHHVEEALRIAKENKLNGLVGRAQFHRGLCCLYMDRYADASWCFTLATHTKDHTEQIEVNRDLAETKREQLGPDDAGRVLTEGFE